MEPSAFSQASSRGVLSSIQRFTVVSSRLNINQSRLMALVCNFTGRTNSRLTGLRCSFWFPRNFPTRHATMRFDVGNPMICLSILEGWFVIDSPWLRMHTLYFACRIISNKSASGLTARWNPKKIFVYFVLLRQIEIVALKYLKFFLEDSIKMSQHFLSYNIWKKQFCIDKGNF